MGVSNGPFMGPSTNYRGYITEHDMTHLMADIQYLYGITKSDKNIGSSILIPISYPITLLMV